MPWKMPYFQAQGLTLTAPLLVSYSFVKMLKEFVLISAATGEMRATADTRVAILGKLMPFLICYC